VNVNFLPMWICLSVFLYVLFTYMYVGVDGVTIVIHEPTSLKHLTLASNGKYLAKSLQWWKVAKPPTEQPESKAYAGDEIEFYSHAWCKIV